MNNMVIHLDITLEIRINHLSNRCGPVYKHQHNSPLLQLHTRESHNLDLFTLLDKSLLQQLHLCSLSTSVQTLQNNECAPS